MPKYYTLKITPEISEAHLMKLHDFLDQLGYCVWGHSKWPGSNGLDFVDEDAEEDREGMR